MNTKVIGINQHVTETCLQAIVLCLPHMYPSSTNREMLFSFYAVNGIALQKVQIYNLGRVLFSTSLQIVNFKKQNTLFFHI